MYSETPALLLFRRQALHQHPRLCAMSTCHAPPCPTCRHHGKCRRETHVPLTASKVQSPPYVRFSCTKHVSVSFPAPEKIGLEHIFQIRSSVRQGMIFFGPPGPPVQAETLNLKSTSSAYTANQESSPEKLGVSRPERPLPTCRSTLLLCRLLFCLICFCDFGHVRLWAFSVELRAKGIRLWGFGLLLRSACPLSDCYN